MTGSAASWGFIPKEKVQKLAQRHSIKKTISLTHSCHLRISNAPPPPPIRLKTLVFEIGYTMISVKFQNPVKFLWIPPPLKNDPNIDGYKSFNRAPFWCNKYNLNFQH
ncbi:hypothetical protein AAZX31_19G051300 [Glycine max]